jgi:hypothetical protein
VSLGRSRASLPIPPRYHFYGFDNPVHVLAEWAL